MKCERLAVPVLYFAKNRVRLRVSSAIDENCTTFEVFEFINVPGMTATTLEAKGLEN